MTSRIESAAICVTRIMQPFAQFLRVIRAAFMTTAEIICGEGGIRTPGTDKQYNGFRGRRIRPLCHLSLSPSQIHGPGCNSRLFSPVFQDSFDLSFDLLGDFLPFLILLFALFLFAPVLHFLADTVLDVVPNVMPFSFTDWMSFFRFFLPYGIQYSNASKDSEHEAQIVAPTRVVDFVDADIAVKQADNKCDHNNQPMP
jgi:hypothetical protein